MHDQNGTAKALKRNEPEIVARWFERVGKTVPAAKSRDNSPVLETVTDYLDGLAALLSSGKERDDTLREVSRQLGRHRARLGGYLPEHILLECNILRQTMFEVLEEREPLGKHDRDVIIDTICDAMIGATAEFVLIERELREQFILMLSHDLRGPLTAAKAAAQLIARAAAKADPSQNLALRICHDVDRADRMIMDLLDASRIRAGERLPLKIGECRLRQVLQESLDELSIIHGRRFNLNGGEDISGYWSCEDLHRIVENIASNAVKYGCPQASIEIRYRQIDAQRVELAIHNSGSLIPPQEQAILLEPFRRAGLVHAGGAKGWGLGLVLVRGLVEAHGGRIWVESSVEGGTTFFVEVPRDARPFQAGLLH